MSCLLSKANLKRHPPSMVTICIYSPSGTASAAGAGAAQGHGLEGSCACRPHHEELHGWANQLLLSKSVLLEALQQQVEKQAAMTELIRKIREPDALAASMPPAPRTHQPSNLEPPSPSASLSIDRDFAHGKVTADILLQGSPSWAAPWLLLA